MKKQRKKNEQKNAKNVERKQKYNFSTDLIHSKINLSFQAKKKREWQLEQAKESFAKWVHDKDAERKRLSEEKRLEKEEHDVKTFFVFSKQNLFS